MLLRKLNKPTVKPTNKPTTPFGATQKDETEYIKEEIKLEKKLSEVDREIKNKENFLPVDIFDIIFGEEEKDIKKVFLELSRKNVNLSLISYCIQYSILIRPTQTKRFLQLLALFAIEGNDDHAISNFVKDLMINQGLIEGDLPKSTINDMLDDFPEGSIGRAIKEDDADLFSSIITKLEFDPKQTIRVEEGTPISYVNDGKHEGIGFGFKDQALQITVMQLIAFYGSIKCFKVAILKDIFKYDNVAKYAIAGGNLEIITTLKNKNKISFDKCFETAIKYHRDDICDWLLLNNKCEVVPLCKTVEYYNYRAFFFILNNKISVSQDSINDAFLSAVKLNIIEIAKYLLEKCNADINGKTNKNEGKKTAIHIACEKGYLKLAKFLIEEHKADFDAKDGLGKTSLYTACENNQKEIAEYLIKECNADVNIKTNGGRTAFQVVCEHSSFEFVKFMYENSHPNIEEKTSAGRTAFLNACSSNNLEVVKYLVEKCKANVKHADSYGKTCLLEAAESGNYEVFKYLVSEVHADVHELYGEGKTILHIACKKGNLQLVKYIVEDCGVDINKKDNYNHPPLSDAIIGEQFDIIKYLIDEKHANIKFECLPMDIRIKDYINRKIEIFEACKRGNLKDVKKCIANDHPYIDQKYKGETALHIACEEGHLEIVKYLVESCKANLEETNKLGKTPLFNACSSGNLDLVKYLIEECKVNTKVVSNSQNSPLDYVTSEKVGLYNYLKSILKEN